VVDYRVDCFGYFIQVKKTYRAVAVLGMLVLLNAACTTSGWRAPLETRGSGKSSPIAKQPSLQGKDRYIVRQGDTLYSIAWRSDQDFQDIAKWNNIPKPYTIYVGQSIRLTAPVVAASRPKPKTPARKPRPIKKIPAKTSQKPSPKINNKRNLAWQWPTQGEVLSTYKAGDRLRKGIKVSGRLGQAIKAAESGRVVYSGSGLIGYGRLVIIKHNEKYLSAYAHNQKLLVREGQTVNKGSKIAELGTANDGRTLLHFEIRRNGKPVNPLGLLPKR
jgi:lipoprotein NlpD